MERRMESEGFGENREVGGLASWGFLPQAPHFHGPRNRHVTCPLIDSSLSPLGVLNLHPSFTRSLAKRNTLLSDFCNSLRKSKLKFGQGHNPKWRQEVCALADKSTTSRRPSRNQSTQPTPLVQRPHSSEPLQSVKGSAMSRFVANEFGAKGLDQGSRGPRSRRALRNVLGHVAV